MKKPVTERLILYDPLNKAPGVVKLTETENRMVTHMGGVGVRWGEYGELVFNR